MVTHSQHPTRSRVAREALLTAGAIAGLVCIAFALAAMFFGITPLIFRSGSMDPAISTGSIALAKTVPATDLTRGDIVSVENAQGARITHRIESIDERTGNTVVATLKGDANAQADADPYVFTEADRVFFSLPGLGYAVSWLSTPSAMIAGVLLAAAALHSAFKPDSGAGQHGSDSRRGVVMSAPVVIGIAAVVALGGSQIQNTKAAFTDTASAASTFTASSSFVRNPDSFTCQDFLSLILSLSWPHQGTGFSYTLTFKNSSGTTVGSPVAVPAPGSGNTVTYTMILNNLGLTSIGNYTVELRSVHLGQTSTDAPLVLGVHRGALTANCIPPTTVNNSALQGISRSVNSADRIEAAAMPPPSSSSALAESSSATPSTTGPPTSTASSTTTASSTSTGATTAATTTTAPPLTTTEPPTTTTADPPTTTPPPTTTTAAPTTTTPPPAATVFTGPEGGNITSLTLVGGVTCTAAKDADYTATVSLACTDGSSVTAAGSDLTPAGVAAATTDGSWTPTLTIGGAPQSVPVVSAIRG